MLQKNLQEVTSLKGQLLQLQNSNRQDALTIQHLQTELQNLEGIRKRVLKLEIENSNYYNELLNLHKRLIKISKTLGTIDLERAKLKEALEQEQANLKVMEQSITLVEKLLVSTKGKVEWLEEQNETFTKTTQKQVELQRLIKKIQLLQQDLEEV